MEVAPCQRLRGGRQPLGIGLRALLAAAGLETQTHLRQESSQSSPQQLPPRRHPPGSFWSLPTRIPAACSTAQPALQRRDAAGRCCPSLAPMPHGPSPPPPPPRLQVRERPLNSLGSRIPSWLHMSHIGAPAIASWGCDDDGTSLAPGSSGGRAGGRARRLAEGAGSKRRGTRTHRAKSVLANASIMQMLLHGILQDAL